ncbi:MAG: mechanosensitive ion channel family protein [Gammaproteobacteria bacterium]
MPSEPTPFLAAVEFGRPLATCAGVALSAGIVRLSTLLAQRSTGGMRKRREQLAWVQNMSIAGGVVAVLFIWGSLIAGFALSLAAVAGATLIVSKELLLNLLGSAVLASTRPYRLDDFIEIAGIRGQVVRVDWLATTLAETLEGNQLTGKTVSVPNGLLLTQPVRNETATGRFIMQLVPLAVSPLADIARLEQLLLEAARKVCAPWLEEAGRHLAQVEARQLVDLPSAEPKVLLNFSDSRHTVLALRYVCRVDSRVHVEQEILRRFWRATREALVALLPASAQEAAGTAAPAAN